MGSRIQAIKERYVNTKVHQHLTANKQTYVTGVVCLLVGALVGHQRESVVGTIDGNGNTFIGKAGRVTIVVEQSETPVLVKGNDDSQ